MHRLLIVDDERHVVESLETVFRQEALELEVLTAYSARDALRVLDAMRIDIILLDIQMPGVSGLALAERIEANWPGARIIFLTGHQTFEYAYRAGRFRNAAFLLKLEDDETIVQAVKEAIGAMEEAQRVVALLSKAEYEAELVRYLLRCDALTTLLRGGADAASPDIAPLKAEAPVLLLHAMLRWPEAAEDIRHSKQLIQLSRRMHLLLGGKLDAALVDLDAFNLLWLLQPAQDMTQQQALHFLKENLDHIVEQVQAVSPQEAVIQLYWQAVPWHGVREVLTHMVERGRQVMPGLAGQVAAMLYRREDALIHSQGGQGLAPDATEKVLRQWAESLNRMDPEGCKRALHALVPAYQAVRSMHSLPIITLYQRMGVRLLEYIQLHGLQEKAALRIGLYELYHVESFAQWPLAFDYLSRVCGVLLSLRAGDTADRNVDLIARIKRYVNDHLGEALTLSSISGHVNYNSAYISRLFRLKEGQTLFDYISTVRMERARALLVSTEESIQEIACQTGYESAQYFSTLFKRVTGMTPSEYKRMHG